MADGRVRWRRPNERPAGPLARPFVAVDGGQVIAAVQRIDGLGELMCCRAGDGAARWWQDSDAPRHLLARRGRVFVRGAQIQSFDAKTGSPAWPVPTGGCSPIALDDDRLYVSERREQAGVFVLRADTGEMVWHRSLASSCNGLSVAGRMAYACARDGTLRAVALEADRS